MLGFGRLEALEREKMRVVYVGISTCYGGQHCPPQSQVQLTMVSVYLPPRHLSSMILVHLHHLMLFYTPLSVISTQQLDRTDDVERTLSCSDF